MMSTETTRTDPNWGSLQGTTLEGGYEVTELLAAGEGTATFKIRVLGDYAQKALVELFRGEAEAAEEQIAIWESVKSERHANLNIPLSVGRIQLDGMDLLYLVLRRPDEQLAGVLRERALRQDEAEEVLFSLARSLEHLHANGFAHGCVSPQETLAIGDSIQLSMDCVRRINSEPAMVLKEPKYLAPESSGENITPASDVWCLGATIFEALTQKEYRVGSEGEAGELPEPFNRVVQRCLGLDPQSRCRASEIAGLYWAAQAVARAAKPVSAPLALPAEKASPANPPRTAEIKPAPVLTRPERIANRPEPQKSRVWLYITIAALAALVLLWMARPKPRGFQAPIQKATAQQAPNAGSGEKAWPTQTLSPDSTSTTAPAPPRQVPQSTTPKMSSPSQANLSPSVVPGTPPKHEENAAPTVNGSIWRVIVYTYARQDAAERKAKELNDKYIGLGAEVFAPKPTGPRLVVIGGQMTRDEAVKLRRKAISMGLPKDSYYQNYKQ